jgi:REP element-mobilizing transposase RayT
MGGEDRKWLRHSRPSWVDLSLPIFLTFCTRPRGKNQLATEVSWQLLDEAAKILAERGKMQPLVLLAMPDHVHLLARIPATAATGLLIRSLKTAVSRQSNVDWQPGFFDHRARTERHAIQLADYIRMNPVRAGLCKEMSDWPYVRRAWPRDIRNDAARGESTSREIGPEDA